MSDRSLAISILQKARDALGQRLTERIVDAQGEIEADAESGAYLSEIETIYDQLGSRLAHINAMLSHLPPANAPAPADATVSEIIYADLASSYPSGFDLEAATPTTLLALPAPLEIEAIPEIEPPADLLTKIVGCMQAGELAAASGLVSELFDIKPSQARRLTVTFARQVFQYPDLLRRFAEMPASLEIIGEQAAAALLCECFELSADEAAAYVQQLSQQLNSSRHSGG